MAAHAASASRRACARVESTAPVARIAAIKDTNALQYTREAAQRETRMANSAISCLTDSNSKAALLQLAAFAVDRSF